MTLNPPSLYQMFLGATGGSAPSIVVALLVSFLLGAIHAASPGHGKTLVVASLLGSRGDFRRALLLAITVAVTHTAGVLLLAIVVTTANASFLTLDLPPVLSIVAAVLVVIFGVDLTRRAWRARSQASEPEHHHAHGSTDHDHASQGHPSRGHPGIELSRGYTMSVGIVGGLVPNATALIVLIMAITFQEMAIGILLIIAFGLGIASVLIAIGVAAILVHRRGGALATGDGPLSRAIAWLPMASALAVLAVGLALTVRAVWMP